VIQRTVGGQLHPLPLPGFVGFPDRLDHSLDIEAVFEGGGCGNGGFNPGGLLAAEGFFQSAHHLAQSLDIGSW